MFQDTPANPPFANRDSYTVTAKLDADGTLHAHSETIFRGESEPYFRNVFRRVPESQWRDYGQQNFYGGRLDGTITNVQVNPPEKTEEPFTLAYDYTVRDFAENHRFAIPLSAWAFPRSRTRTFNGRRLCGSVMLASRCTNPASNCQWGGPAGLEREFREFHGDTSAGRPMRWPLGRNCKGLLPTTPISRQISPLVLTFPPRPS